MTMISLGVVGVGRVPKLYGHGGKKGDLILTNNRMRHLHFVCIATQSMSFYVV